MRLKTIKYLLLFVSIFTSLTASAQTAEASPAVDLGLSSGNLWATYNVGATKETDSGVYVAWGELEEKISEGYYKENYAYWSADNPDHEGYSTVLGTNIAGTGYDIAHVRWKGDWQMPTDSDMKELRDECTWVVETRSGVSGYKVTGPNGNSIFLPFAGYYNGKDLISPNSEGNYWCSTIYMYAREYQLGYALSLGQDIHELSRYSRKGGCTVRPVIHKGGLDPVFYTFSIQSGSGGTVSYNNTTITNTTQSFTVAEGTSATITISPNSGYKLSMLTVNGTNVTSSVSNNQYIISSITAYIIVVATFEQVATTTYSLSIQSGNGGSLLYNGTTVTNTNRLFTVESGKSAIIEIIPNSGYKLSSLTLNGSDVTSSVVNNQYIINSITADTKVVATFNALSDIPVAVDLGLYSGNLWATYNVGATKETDSGVYVAWGELEEKVSEGYYRENYAYWSEDNPDHEGYSTVLGTNIAGTEYDIAHVRWKGDWQMPTDSDMKELRDDCTWEVETRSGVSGYKVTGPNGNSIFLPFAGYYNGKDLISPNSEGNYWCSTMYMFAREYQMGYAMSLGQGVYELSRYSRKGGCTVRPVIHKGGVTTYYSLSIQSGSGGSVSYGGKTVTNTSQSFAVATGTSATITISPDTGYKLSKLTVNGTNVTSSVSNNQYTINNITTKTTVVATFEQIPSTGLEVNATNFPDEAFRNWVLQNVSGASDGILTDDEIAKVTSINCSNKNLSNLQGIEFFTALTTLNCSGNKLSSLDVSKNTALKKLSCQNNKLVSLDVSGCTAITEIECFSNQLTSLDVSKNTALTSLNCNSNQLASLDVSRNAALVNLYCGSNQLKSLDISNNTALKELNCQINSITNLSGLSADLALTLLICDRNQLKTLDVSRNTALTRLYCHTNQFTSLNVSRNTALTLLYCYNNQLTTLDLSKNTVLESLYCDDNQLSKLDVTNNTALKELSIDNNRLTSLDVTKNTSLTLLSCVNNLLTNLDVSRNTALSSFWCNNNQLTVLDVSRNTKLTRLDCYGNQLLCLNLGTNTSINDASTSISPQSAALSAQNISEGISIPVPSDFDYSKVSNLKLGGASVTGSVATVNNQKYLVFAKTGTSESAINGKMLTYSYNTGNSFSQAASMDVTVSLSYTATTPTGIEVNATNFPDEAFRNWILQNVSGASDGILTEEEIARVTSINCSSYNSYSITTLQGIEFFSALTDLRCHYNQLTVLDVSNNLALNTLICSNNQLIALDVTKNTALTELRCSSNQLTSLDVSKNTALTFLACEFNQLTSLDVSKNTALTELYCNSNQLTSLEVSQNTALEGLYCPSNKLTALDVSKNTALASLYCSSNQLTSLDVSKNTALTSLHCYSNQLTCLELSNNSRLTSASITPQTISFIAEDISEGIAIPVSFDFDLTRVTNLKLDGTNITGNVLVVDGQKYLVLAQKGTDEDFINGKSLTYTYLTGNSLSTASSMDVTVTLSYAAANYSLSLQSGSGGSVSYNGTVVTNSTRQFTVERGLSATISITPNNGYILSSLTVNGNDVTSNVVNNQYTISNITANISVVASFEQIPATTYSLYIQSGSGGSVSYNETTITNKTQSFPIAEGSSVTIELTPSNGYKLASLVVNGTDVTSGVVNNQYTISNITANTTVVVTFKAIPQTISVDGINYEVRSANDYTLNVGKGNYSGHVVIPATVSYDGDTWTVAGVVDGAFNLSAITAVTWNPNTAIGNGAFGAQTNPNLLLYVKSEAYAPTNVQNVIANGRARKIVLTDAASGNDFNCPEAFTAEEISYTHRYGMTTGIGECRGWETIALPFDVKQFTHESKGALVPFKAYYSGSPNKPFWLYELSASGFVEAESIEAYTPYIISMPNNDYYDTAYHLSGRVTFAATNAKVGVTELKRPKSGDKSFVPNFSMQAASESIFPLNVNNDFFNNNEYYAEGSHFVKGSRHVLPFEAYMTTSAANAKGIIPIFETQPTAIREIPMQGLWGETGVKVYNLNGQLVLWSEGMTREEALKRLPAGIYIMNGKKITIK